MTLQIQADIAVIGGGSGGLSVAAGAAQMGATVVLIEHNKMGGDCLNVGCVPSKSLLAAAKKHSGFLEALQYMKSVIETIAPHDSIERFESLGVKVITASAKFVSENKITAGDYEISAKRVVIATGSSPFVPPIPGLAEIPFYTNETIFELKEKPSHLIVIGGGPIGCELAQAFSLLGCKVTLLEMFTLLPKDDPEMVEIIRQDFQAQGLIIKENINIIEIKHNEVMIESQGEKQVISGSHFLVAAGRRPNVSSLNLEEANIVYSPKGIQVDKYLRTSNKKIYAIGDVVGFYQFTHIANYHAGIVIKNILFKLFAQTDYRVVPWVTYTEPELAQVGLTEKEALQKYKSISILSASFSDNDRAQTAKETQGKIKVMTDKKGVVLGVTVLGINVGELLLPWILLMQHKMKLRALTDCIVPYPTLSEISKRVAGQFYTPLLFSGRMKKWVRFLQKMMR